MLCWPGPATQDDTDPGDKQILLTVTAGSHDPLNWRILFIVTKNILKQRLVALTVSNRKYFILLGMIYLHPFPSLSDFLIWGDFENLSDPGKIQWSRVAKSLTRHADLGFIELWENPFISQSSAPALGQTTPDLTLIKSQDHEICFIRAVRLSVIISRFSELVLA